MKREVRLFKNGKQVACCCGDGVVSYSSGDKLRQNFKELIIYVDGISFDENAKEPCIGDFFKLMIDGKEPKRYSKVRLISVFEYCDLDGTGKKYHIELTPVAGLEMSFKEMEQISMITFYKKRRMIATANNGLVSISGGGSTPVWVKIEQLLLMGDNTDLDLSNSEIIFWWRQSRVMCNAWKCRIGHNVRGEGFDYRSCSFFIDRPVLIRG